MDLIKTKYGFRSNANDIIEEVDLNGKRAIVTGGASGIGIETVRSLAMAGAEVTIAVRNTEVGQKVADEIIADTGNSRVYVSQLDLNSLDSVKNFVNNWRGALDILINNAGVMAIPELQKTDDGVEMQFMTNYLGHFALSLGLHTALKSAKSSRVVVVASSGHLFSPVTFDDINFLFRPYDPLVAYGQAKTACILFAVGATERWAKDGITINALNPGAILTNLQKHVGGKLRSAPELHKTSQQGAATSILLATSPLLENISGRYFEDCNEVETVYERPANYKGVAMYAIDKENADRLWNTSLKLIGEFNY